MRVPRLRRPRIRTIAFLTACLLAGGGLSVAGAAVVFDGSITGSALTAPDDPGVYYSDTGLVATPDASGVTCAQTPTGAILAVSGYYASDVLSLQDAYPGSTCTFTVDVIVQGATAGAVLQDVVVKGGFTAALGSSCGEAISTNPASPTAVTFTVSAPTGAAWGLAETIPLTGDLQAVPTGSYDPSACT
jgi:hypothetical protein